jgi:hypothetical protein
MRTDESPRTHAYSDTSAEPAASAVIANVIVQEKRPAASAIVAVIVNWIVQGAVVYVDSSITLQLIARRTRCVNSVSMLVMSRRTVTAGRRRSRNMPRTHGYDLSTATANAMRRAAPTPSIATPSTAVIATLPTTTRTAASTALTAASLKTLCRLSFQLSTVYKSELVSRMTGGNHSEPQTRNTPAEARNGAFSCSRARIHEASSCGGVLRRFPIALET